MKDSGALHRHDETFTFVMMRLIKMIEKSKTLYPSVKGYLWSCLFASRSLPSRLPQALIQQLPAFKLADS
jgi:hypothetical protein